MNADDRSPTILKLLVMALSSFLLFSGCEVTPDTYDAPRLSQEDVSQIPAYKQNLSMAEALKHIQPAEYVLGPDDTIEISLLEHPELQMQVTVSPTGKIQYYLIDQMQAAGLDQFQLRDAIQQALTRFIRDPKVVVRIVEYRSHKVFVLGQVHSPGIVRMKSSISLLEALSNSGGITTDAYLSGAFVVRDDNVLIVNFPDLIQKGNTRENIPLLPDDIIFIPDRRDLRVYVLGEVNKQTSLPMRENFTLIEAVTDAGGFTHDAKKGSILLMRGNLSVPQIYTISAANLLSDTFTANIPLQQGDIIYVDSSEIADLERAAIRISNILQPFLDVARGIILWGNAIDCLQGDCPRTRVIR